MAEHLERVEWLTEFLNLTAADAYYLISTGRLPGVVRLGPRMIRVDPDVVREWVTSGGFERADDDAVAAGAR